MTTPEMREIDAKDDEIRKQIRELFKLAENCKEITFEQLRDLRMEEMIWEIGKGLEDLVKEQERNWPYDSEEMQLRAELFEAFARYEHYVTHEVK